MKQDLEYLCLKSSLIFEVVLVAVILQLNLCIEGSLKVRKLI